LPASDKMTAPRYQDIAPARIPEVVPAEGAVARVIAGELAGVSGPVSGVATSPLYVDLHLDPRARADVAVPTGHNAFAYVYEGDVELGPPDAARRTGRGELAVLERH